MVEHGRIGFRLRTEMHEQRGVAAVIEDHVRAAAVGPLEDAVGVFPVFGQRLALDREHRGAGGGDRRGGVVLRRVDVAGCPAHVGAQCRERLDQHGGLDGHVQRAGDAGAAQRLLRAVFLARRHEARHLGLGNGDFLAAPFGEAEVLDDIIGVIGVRGLLRLGRRGHGDPLALLAVLRRSADRTVKRPRSSGRRRDGGDKDIKIALCLYLNHRPRQCIVPVWVSPPNPR